VIAPADGRAVDVRAAAYTVASDEGVAVGQRARFPIPDGEPAPRVRARVTDWLVKEGKGGARVTYRLRDWVFSRQRYWGEPIPIYFPVETAGDPREAGAKFTVRYDEPIALGEAELPLALPDLEDFRPGQDPAGPLARARDWRFFQKGGKWYARETNTMPQWAGSCWYYLRYLDPRNDREGWSQKAYDEWMPVDLYVGGSEHAVLHLLYARFWHKVLYDIGAVRHTEPFAKLVHQGMILGENNEKMSKSRGNVINPDDVVRDHGADALRVYEMFMGPLEQVKPWQTSGIEGVRRFLDRVWRSASSPLSDACDAATKRAVHKTIKKVTDDIEGMRFNTAISEMMILVKHLGTLAQAPRLAVEALALLLSPFAPHLGEEIWARLGHTSSLAYEPWPTFDPSLVKDDVVEIGVQVNGKLRGTVTLPVDAGEEAAMKAALADAKVGPHVTGKTVKKVVYVAGKILNVIVA
jgi:leucyl-tRNA synthetase